MAFMHKQTVRVHRLRVVADPQGRPAWIDDWSETATVRGTKRDLRPLGYWLVRFADGGELCVHEERLRAN